MMTPTAVMRQEERGALPPWLCPCSRNLYMHCWTSWITRSGRQGGPRMNLSQDAWIRAALSSLQSTRRTMERSVQALIRPTAVSTTHLSFRAWVVWGMSCKPQVTLASEEPVHPWMTRKLWWPSHLTQIEACKKQVRRQVLEK